MKAKISEIFKSIQGEGAYQGRNQVFVRFFGCNLSCRFCDTKPEYYQEKTLDQVIREIYSYQDYHSVSLTGGEPLLQAAFLKALAHELKAAGKLVYLETNGILHQSLEEVLDFIDIIAMDFKLFTSTGIGDFWRQHREFLKISKDKDLFVKAVIRKKTHIDDLRIGLGLINETRRKIPLILQPENPFEDDLKEKLSYFEKICQERGIDVKIVPQLHKELKVR